MGTMNDIFMKDAYNGYSYKYTFDVEPVYSTEAKRKLLKKKLNKLKLFEYENVIIKSA